jgi:hypothetical protein
LGTVPTDHRQHGAQAFKFFALLDFVSFTDHV